LCHITALNSIDETRCNNLATLRLWQIVWKTPRNYIIYP
jgi:hypothetical protein